MFMAHNLPILRDIYHVISSISLLPVTLKRTIMKFIFATLTLFSLNSCSNKGIDYEKYKETQDYKVPFFVDSYKSKIALFIFPHPDDEIVCAGTISQLKKSGWTVNLLTLTQGQPDQKTTRKNEWTKAVNELKVDKYEILDLPNNTWNNVMSNNITFWYDNKDSLEKIVYKTIQKYNPTVLFTYDTALGAYGHPEHRISALAAIKVFQKHKQDTLFSVESILQITLPEKQEQLMLNSAESYKNAIKLTGNNTLPDPTLAFDISKYWEIKRKAASLYTSQLGSMKKFFLLPEIKDTTNHYRTFDREYYFEVRK
jgi:LmbE family N-acetylglucosaminyl deacetylase